jgi:hypothetical protein
MAESKRHKFVREVSGGLCELAATRIHNLSVPFARCSGVSNGFVGSPAGMLTSTIVCDPIPFQASQRPKIDEILMDEGKGPVRLSTRRAS